MCCHLGWKQVGAWIKELPSWSGKVESGQDWETVVLVALCLRCYEAKYSEPHELLGLPKGALRPAAVYVEKVPQENATKPTNSHAGLVEGAADQNIPLHSGAVAHFF
ncbi:unnamed protein product [Effrenium voratum]|nr:unnamed protein product [Effrenium voratum]